MAEELLDCSEISAAVEQVCRCAVAERVWPGRSGWGVFKKRGDQSINLSNADSRAPRTQKHRRVGSILCKRVSAITQPIIQGISGRLTERNHAFFRAFSHQANNIATEIHISKI